MPTIDAPPKMRVCGIDFTSAPTPSKPIVCATGWLDGRVLQIEELRMWASFAPFESFLTCCNEASLTGVDLPLGQPRRLVRALGWPTAWSEYVRFVGSMSKSAFVKAITRYCDAQPAGDKHHRRATDEVFGSLSPMMLYGVPVGKMFFEGAPRIEASPASVLPCRPNHSKQIVVEAYPALVVRRLLGARPYKNDTTATRAEKRNNRQRLLDAATTSTTTAVCPITVTVPPSLVKQAALDPSGDLLDAILCAIQVASAYIGHGVSLGIPRSADPVEGWIVDMGDPR